MRQVKEILSLDKTFWNRVMSNPSAQGLLGANAAVLVLTILCDWNLGFALVSYWWQNVIIGGFNVLKILSLDGIRKYGAPADAPYLPAPAAGKAVLAGFFALHYGFFHYGYLMFLQGYFREVNAGLVLLSVLAFVAYEAYLFSTEFWPNRAAQDSGKLFAQPYARIIPMHVVIIFGTMIMLMIGALLGEGAAKDVGEKVVLVFFVMLKIKADMHMQQTSS